MQHVTGEKIALRNVTKAYGAGTSGVLALKAVNLTVAAGEFVSIVGPSGCGKSTLLYVLGGFVDAHGEVLVDGRPVAGPGLDRGVVFQEYALFPWLTVRRNIEYGLEMRGLRRAERAELAAHYVRMIGLEGFEDRFPRELSGGMRQRVAIARTLACEPEILLLDEPFGALDAQTREVMQDELLNIWRDTHQTVLMVTHDVTEAVYLSNRVCVMSRRPGQIVAEFAVDLDRSPSREEIALAPRFNELRNEVWLSVRRQAAAKE
jgi:NitT/TauT family transport system ATP-binding protein